LCLSLDQRTEPLRFLIHDRDSKFSGAFDEVFSTEGIEIVKTPIRSPRANAIAERWIRTVRAECLDWLLIAGDGHLHRVLRTYANHYNQQRPHRGLDLKAPGADHLDRSAAGLREADALGDPDRLPVRMRVPRRTRPGVKWTLLALRRERPDGIAAVSTYTAPVNHSLGPDAV
jgi:hypothetical protein